MREQMLKERAKLGEMLDDRTMNKSSINRPLSSSTSSSLFDSGKISSKQAIIKRHMLNSLYLSAQQKMRLGLEDFDKIAENVKKLNEQNPIALLRFQARDITKINRIYLLSYFRSGSSFLGDLLQQHYRTFYQFEPLHFRSVASRLPSNESKTDSSINLVLDMVNECNFRGKANYLNWISKEGNKFLLSWNHFLYSLCRYNQSKCIDEKFVEQVCDLAEQRVTKLTRVNLYDLIKLLNTDNSFNEYVKEFIRLNATMSDHDLNRLEFQILNQQKNSMSNRIQSTYNQTNNSNDEHSKNRTEATHQPTSSAINASTMNRTLNESSLVFEVEPIKIIYLVRDPRAIYSSRQYLNWCKNRASCISVDSLCEEMNHDFKTFETLYSKFSDNSQSRLITINRSTRRYPIQLFMIRFETIALDPFNSTTQLFKAVNLPLTNNIKRFVYTHTSTNLDSKTPFKKWYLNKVSNDPHSTKRNSNKIPFDWIHKLSWLKIDEIQNKCEYSMRSMGYKSITNEQFKNIPKNLSELLFADTNRFTLF